MATDPRTHWESVYEQKAPDTVSWFQRDPHVSYALIERAAAGLDENIVDIGGGASRLVDTLIAAGYTNISVLDVASAAIAHARDRLGPTASRVSWIVADVLSFDFPPQSMDVWHDRAMFHFLTRAEDRARYLAQVQRAVRPGGHVLIATFAEDGPTKCSGLDVNRYSAAQLYQELGPGFVLETSVREDHVTPSGAHQAFTYCLCRWEPGALAHGAA